MSMKQSVTVFLVFCLPHALMSLQVEKDGMLFGSCSIKCINDTESHQTDLLFPCSCSPSCVHYGDCCYDSKWRPREVSYKPPKTACLHLSGNGKFKAIAKCALDQGGVWDFCEESIGHLPPVTSPDSGATYANINCALCNSDGGHFVPWKVDIKCCKEHDLAATEIEYKFSGDNLWSYVKIQDGDNKGLPHRCQCRYVAKPGAKNFTKSFELRRCYDETEISSCSTSWSNQETSQACKSYLDPVYVRGKVYRNQHCAQCNFENLSYSRCRPRIVDEIFLAGAKYSEARQLCQLYGLRACIHYLNRGKGRRYAFSELFTLSVRQCMPLPGKRCCEGERYDFIHKTCRKFQRGITQT